MFKCEKCGATWEWADADGIPEYCENGDFGLEHVGCGGSVRPAERCNDCGEMRFTGEDDGEQELFGGYCLDCIKKSISLEVARWYFDNEGCMVDFMTERVWECGQPSRVTAEFTDVAFRDFDWFMMTHPEALRDKCVEWILDDYDWTESYVQFAEKMGFLGKPKTKVYAVHIVENGEEKTFRYGRFEDVDAIFAYCKKTPGCEYKGYDIEINGEVQHDY